MMKMMMMMMMMMSGPLIVLLLQLLFLLNVVKGEAVQPTFDEFQGLFSRSYADENEKLRRERTYNENLEKIRKLNSAPGSAVFRVNAFADLSTDEFRAQYLLPNAGLKRLLEMRRRRAQPGRAKGAVDFNVTKIPSGKSWYMHATTAVRDQGQCGSCWGFSNVEQVESDWFLAKGVLEELSVQQLLDCDKEEAYGCGGTYAGGGSGYDYIISNHGLESEKAYPYVSGKTGVEQKCKAVPQKVAGGTIRNFSYAIPECYLPWDNCDNQDEQGIIQYLNSRGPLAVCVNARNWQFYHSGVLEGSTCGGHSHADLDHCVQLVGYANMGTKNASYEIRNSWGTAWGNAGLISLAFGNNTCGVADTASYTIV